MDPKQRILETAQKLGLAMTAEFVPWSQSRNKSEKTPSLNWKVTIFRGHGKVEGGQAILSTDYMAGSAHCPSYKQGDRTLMQRQLIAFECEHGVPGRWFDNANVYRDIRKAGKPIMPNLADVLYSLASDYDVLDAGSYEEWASNYGYDPDSRKGEATYRACLDIALKLRNGVGEEGMQQLRDACQDY